LTARINSLHPEAGPSVVRALLGESRLALSGHFYEVADVYFHKGVEHTLRRAFENDFFQRIAGEVSPRRHAHIGGQAIKEIMPWLRLATRMDPRNVEIYLVAAFWLAGDAGRPDLAHEVLREAKCNNRFNYRLQLEDGRIYLRERRMEEAKRAFDAGLAFWPSDEQPDSNEALLGKANILLHRALLHEAENEIDEAVAALQEILSIFPERTHLNARIVALKEDRQPSVLASRLWSDMLQQHQELRSACSRDYSEYDQVRAVR